MIRILHVVHGMDCGGTENIIMNLYRNTDRTKVQFDFLVHTEKKCFFDDEIKSLGGRIFRIPYYNIINLFAYKKAVKRCQKEGGYCQKIRADFKMCLKSFPRSE